MSRTTLPARVEVPPTTDHYVNVAVSQQRAHSRLAEQDEFARRMEERVRRMEEDSLNKVRLQEEEIHRRNLERVNQIRVMQEMGARGFGRGSDPLGESRGGYEARMFQESGGYGGAR